MSEPFLGEIKIVAFNFPPRGWAFCNGQLMAINQNQALFAILGTTYGGDGRSTFALPNFQGRVPLHMGNGFQLGQIGGEATHTLSQSEMPAHTHTAAASSAAADVASPSNAYFGNGSEPAYTTALGSPTTLGPTAISVIGGSQPHENLSPYLVLAFAIALQGIFPSQN